MNHFKNILLFLLFIFVSTSLSSNSYSLRPYVVSSRITNNTRYLTVVVNQNVSDEIALSFEIIRQYEANTLCNIIIRDEESSPKYVHFDIYPYTTDTTGFPSYSLEFLPCCSSLKINGADIKTMHPYEYISTPQESQVTHRHPL